MGILSQEMLDGKIVDADKLIKVIHINFSFSFSYLLLNGLWNRYELKAHFPRLFAYLRGIVLVIGIVYDREI